MKSYLDSIYRSSQDVFEFHLPHLLMSEFVFLLVYDVVPCGKKHKGLFDLVQTFVQTVQLNRKISGEIHQTSQEQRNPWRRHLLRLYLIRWICRPSILRVLPLRNVFFNNA